MATLDGYEPYATGMTAKMAVEALWRSYNLPEKTKEILEHSCVIYDDENPPTYLTIKELEGVKFPIWHNLENNKYYYGDVSDTLRNIVWFQFF